MAHVNTFPFESADFNTTPKGKAWKIISLEACFDEFSGNLTLSRQVLKGPMSLIVNVKDPSGPFYPISSSSSSP